MPRTDCPDCGERSTRDTDFCAACGSFLDWQPAEPALVGLAPARKEAGAAPGPPVLDDGPAMEDRPTTVLPAAEAMPREPAEDVPGPSGCPRCATPRRPGLRFCAKCAHEFDPPSAATAWGAPRSRRRSWWRRLLGRERTPVERAALRAYRRSLPLRHRLFRLGVTLLTLALVAGLVLAVRGNPVAWVQSRWDDLRDVVERVPVDPPTLDPPTATERVEYQPRFATDGDERSAWATAWTGGEGPVACGARRTAEALQLTFSEVVDLRSVEVLAGLPSGDPDRTAQHRPKTLELRFSDGSCVLLPVQDVGAPQRIDLEEPVSTSSVRVDVVEVHPADGADRLVAISELTLLRRPAH